MVIMPNTKVNIIVLGRFIPLPNNVKTILVIIGPTNQAIGRLIKKTKKKFIPKSCVRGITGSMNPLTIPINIPPLPIVDIPTVFIPALCINE